MQTKLTITTESPEAATALIEILAEMNRAIKKHPVWPMSPVERAAIVVEEAGEVIREANHIREGAGDVQALRMELIQTAGTCIRMINLMDAEKHCSIPVFHEQPKTIGLGFSALFDHDAHRRFSQHNSFALNNEG